MHNKNRDYNVIKERYNLRLRDKNQQIYVDFLNYNTIIFSNKKVFIGKDRKKWINILNKSKILITYFDDIINDKISIEDVKKIIYSNHGKLAWKNKRNQITESMKGRVPWNAGLYGEGNPFYGRKHTQESKTIISEKNKGKNNGMYGKTHNEDTKNNHSKKMKKMILDGKFTPNSNNRHTFWESTLDGNKYRSSWECLYKFYNQNSFYEKLRIKYYHNNKEKIYIVDFIDEINKIVVEVKPNNILKQKISKIKLSYLNQWCLNNNYSLIIANEDWILENIKEEFIDYNRFDKNTQKKIKKFYEINKKNRN